MHSPATLDDVRVSHLTRADLRQTITAAVFRGSLMAWGAVFVASFVAWLFYFLWIADQAR